MSTNKEGVKPFAACWYCRRKKVKCDGLIPCGNCCDRNNECNYPPTSRGRRRRNRRGPDGDTAGGHIRPATPGGHGHLWITEDPGNGLIEEIVVQEAGSQNDLQRSTDSSSRPSADGPSLSSDNIADAASSSRAKTTPAMDSAMQQTRAYPEQTACQPPTQSHVFKDPGFDGEEVTVDLKEINWQYHGPGSWLSICSEPGIRWVSNRTGTDDFHEIAQGLITDWTKHLTLSQLPTWERKPDLDADRAWRYSSRYFDYAVDSAFGVVYRPEFEEHLRVHFQNPLPADEDPTLYALRNAVYAVGCRAAALADGTDDFTEAHQRSLQLFFNAFSVYPHLVFMPSGLRAVQALIVMTSYAELLGSPSVEYMLCGAAARLAQSKGLHRQPAAAWHLPQLELLHRNWTFWAVYCYDKYLALRSGRPPILEDDEISCEVPTEVPKGSSLNIEVFTAVIEHAKICAKISKTFFSAKSLNQPPEVLVRKREDLEERLTEWRNCLPPRLARLCQNAPGTVPEHYQTRASIFRLHRAYHGSMMALHANFHYPWVWSRIVGQSPALLRDSASDSSATAARHILTSLRDWGPDISSSSTTIFFYPMAAIITLFVHVLKFPALETTESDLALLDIGAGHFGQVHHLTSSHVSFKFPREAVGLASQAVKRARASRFNGTGASPSKDLTANTTGDLTDMPFFDSELSPEQWSALSAEIFHDFALEGDMIML